MKKLIFLLSLVSGIMIFSQNTHFANLKVKNSNKSSSSIIAFKYGKNFVLNENNVKIFGESLKNKLKKENSIEVNYIESEIVNYGNNLYNLVLKSDNGYITKSYLKISEDGKFLLRAPDMGISCTTTACAQTTGCVAAFTACTECAGDCTKTTTN